MTKDFNQVFEDLEIIENILIDKLNEASYRPDNFIQDLYFIWLSYRAYDEFKKGTLDSYLDDLISNMKNNVVDKDSV